MAKGQLLGACGLRAEMKDESATRASQDQSSEKMLPRGCESEEGYTHFALVYTCEECDNASEIVQEFGPSETILSLCTI